MCTSIVSNRKKTIIGWNLDILDMKYKVVTEDERVYIAIYDEKEGWMPLFGANARGDFVAMPTCWPFDDRSNPADGDRNNLLMLDIDLLLGKRTLSEIRRIAESEKICSIPGVTFQAQLSDGEGNVLQIIPGQGYQYKEKPVYSVLTNFSPFKGDSEVHPWMGMDRYETAVAMMEQADDHFDVDDCFEVLKATAQTVCPTVVSMVYDVTERTVYWCENREWTQISKWKM
ncbi:MAG: hypothetical protein SPJ81_05635 [Lachnoclostridium sp.]|nr:hypothetical protein [Lachnoclostridium sp.]